MIGFLCEHCGGPVRVTDAHAGKKGRCPHCQAVVNIPHTSTVDADSLNHVPPPPTVSSNDTDEFHLADTKTAMAFETDTYPAIQDSDKEETPPEQPSKGELSADQAKTMQLAGKAIVVMAIGMTLALAGGVFAVWWFCFRQ